MEECHYLGFDYSTQQIKAVIVNQKSEIISEFHVQFDLDLPEYGTKGGVIEDKGTGKVTSPTIMWVKATDLILSKMVELSIDFSKIVALSGSGQQHGSVYWRSGAEILLKNLNADSSLATQLSDAFSIDNSPIWMDSSTREECENLTKDIGGEMELVRITGSKAYERLTGHQISKLRKDQPEKFFSTERISLVSSFACSLFVGRYAPIDFSDGSGMNLLDITKKEWSSRCLQTCADNLDTLLGTPVSSQTIVGPISEYMSKKYGFPSNCRVVTFTGDNPASIVAMALGANDICVSLGTSDTLILRVESPRPVCEALHLVSPLNSDEYVVLLCSKNGSLVRERLRDLHANASWQQFDDILKKADPNENTPIGLYFDMPEISPPLKGIHRFDNSGVEVSTFTADVEIQTLVQGQCISKLICLEKCGYPIHKDSRIIATGGASRNIGLLQIYSDVFGLPVDIQDITNSACLGAAYQSMTATGNMCRPDQKLTRCCKPNEVNTKQYRILIRKYNKKIEELLIKLI